MEEEVILVDESDCATGTMSKMQAHLEGALHRAFSVFIFNSRDELLLQQRAMDKYHSGGKWTNTCCSHPRPGERSQDAANRRLLEEMGLDCELIHQFNFTYRARLENNLVEHEFDHVFFGTSDALPVPSPREVMEVKYVGLDQLAADLAQHPAHYSEWLRICLDRVIENYRQYVKRAGY
ncbi:isopentenyl-diphosphate Delta-isomerase [Hufsiella ginkgonis]|uniref:Isopentenyl-diphosphate delta-isomerase n=1 Tax=Hufsiella ginkgonis TaxID=2695274 RepID=A0A7K1XSX3_9SPHI|nr:isopentenyl-diphosphate Delta-isomerase [Hufsiella ginkgonis]